MFVVKRQCVKKKKVLSVFCKIITVCFEWEARKTGRVKNFLSSRLEKYGGKSCFKRLVRASFCLSRFISIANDRG